MLSNGELTTGLKILQSAMEDLVKEKLMNQQIIEDMLAQIQTTEHEVKILKRTIGMGDLEQIPPADYEIAAEDEQYAEVPCLHLHWDRDYDNGVRTCKDCGHQEELY